MMKSNIVLGSAMTVCIALLASMHWELNQTQIKLDALVAHLQPLSQAKNHSAQKNKLTNNAAFINEEMIAELISAKLKKSFELNAYANPRESSVTITTEEQEQNKLLAKQEANQLISHLKGRETYFDEWLAVGQKLNQLQPNAYRSMVLQRILAQVNQQELSPPSKGNIMDALQGINSENLY